MTHSSREPPESASQTVVSRAMNVTTNPSA